MEYMYLAEEGNIEILRKIHGIIAATLPYRIVSHPTSGKMVISHTDTLLGKKVNLNEVLATHCEVEVDGNPGFGCIPGNEPEWAEYAAIIDSLMWNEHPALEKIRPLINEIRNEIYLKWQNRHLELCV